MRKRTKSIDGARVDVGLLDEKAINSTGQSPQRTKPTKQANVRWADIVKRGLEKRRRSPMTSSHSIRQAKPKSAT